MLGAPEGEAMWDEGTMLTRDPPTSPPGMPLIYWFSRRMTLWGSISFNLAVFINIIIAFFYPYMEGASTGGDTRLADCGPGDHRASSLGLGGALWPARL